ncbi:MAG: hypothetical protein HRU76_13775 [Phycisphaeraceae bacterium]|nr:hypothetical protein [Phycisphaerales bacterium]QOJ18588.1 MAG: hypothetical protein HRU76_13775 [Phycisphaeraceae bacterium]
MAKNRASSKPAASNDSGCDDDIIAAIVSNPNLVRVDASGGDLKPVLTCKPEALRALIGELKAALQD